MASMAPTVKSAQVSRSACSRITMDTASIAIAMQNAIGPCERRGGAYCASSRASAKASSSR